MPITITHQAFSRATHRNWRHTRSPRMTRVLACLLAHQNNRSERTILQLKRAIDVWWVSDPQEIANRDVGNIITDLLNEGNAEHRFFQQLSMARYVVDGLLNNRRAHVVNDADTRVENQPRLKASMFAQLNMALRPDAGSNAMIGNLGLRNRAHWEQKGIAVANQPAMDIRCAESAALVIHTLSRAMHFNLPLSVIEQGNGSIDGHFWVIAGHITGTGDPDFGPDTFAIDLWGRATNHVNQIVVGPPGRRPFNMRNNRIRVRVTWP